MQIVITTTYIARHKIYCTELENTISFIITINDNYLCPKPT
jgi:hypothetical protein